MIGNDVVDLEYASIQSNWKRPGFLHKVFTEKEQLLITGHNNPDLITWLLWSMKESAYKIWVRQMHKRLFAPLLFECSIVSTSEMKFLGKVSFEELRYNTKSEDCNGVIYTLAVPESGKLEKRIIYNKIKFSNNYFDIQHKQLNNSVLEKISELKQKSLKQLRIKKNSLGVPMVFFNNQKMDLFVSLSHHGCYGAYAIVTS